MATVPLRCRRQFCGIKTIGDPAPFLSQLRMSAVGQSLLNTALFTHGGTTR